MWPSETIENLNLDCKLYELDFWTVAPLAMPLPGYEPPQILKNVKRKIIRKKIIPKL